MTIEIPEFMPVLSHGSHKTPAEGACVMEYVSFLAGEDWTDAPECADIVLTAVAQVANDNLTDSNRQQMLPYLPILLNSATVAPRSAEEAAHVLTMHDALVGYFRKHEPEYFLDYVEEIEQIARHSGEPYSLLTGGWLGHCRRNTQQVHANYCAGTWISRASVGHAVLGAFDGLYSNIYEGGGRLEMLDFVIERYTEVTGIDPRENTPIEPADLQRCVLLTAGAP